MTKWSKDKSKEQVLTDVKEIFDKYGVKKAEVIDYVFWTNGEVEQFFVTLPDGVNLREFKDELCDYFFDLDTFPDGNCGALVRDINDPIGATFYNFYKDRQLVVYEDGKWVNIV